MWSRYGIERSKFCFILGPSIHHTVLMFIYGEIMQDHFSFDDVYKNRLFVMNNPHLGFVLCILIRQSTS